MIPHANQIEAQHTDRLSKVMPQLPFKMSPKLHAATPSPESDYITVMSTLRQHMSALLMRFVNLNAGVAQ